ncbi:MAG: sulfatase-like hydrolase/transferase, partial [Candidatus Binatia bacterium]
MAVVVGCHASPPARPAPLFAVKRLVDDAPATLAPGLVWGEYLRIADEDRLTLSSLSRRGSIVQATPSAEIGATWSVAIPPVLQEGGSWLGLQPMVRFGDGSLHPLPLRFVAPASATASIGIERGVLDGIPDVSVVAQLTLVPDMGVRDVVSRPFIVAPGSVLAFGAAIEETALAADPTPIDFHVSVLTDGNESEVHRLRLDPVQREDHRRWVDARADLGAFAGRTVQLRLSTTFADPAHRGTSLPVWADPVVLVPRSTHPINVVLISLDTLRARSVRTYGAERPTTPRLDRFGAEGVVFDTAHTTAPHTLPAHVSVFTGLYLRRHGITNPLRAFPPDVETPTEVLRAAGYETAAFTEDGFVVPTVGIRRGFSTYRENTSPNVHQPLGQAAQTFRAGVDWLARHRDQPFFLFLHTYQVHFPY